MIKTLLENSITNASQIGLLKEWKKEEIKKAAEQALAKKLAGIIPVATGSIQGDGSHITINLIDIVDFLIEQVVSYYKVSHYIPQKTRPPTTVYEMLQWVTGLKYNHVYDGVKNHIRTLFPKPDAYKEHPDYSLIPTDKLTFRATTEIKYDELTDALGTVCSKSRSTLKAIMGHGHSDGRYACEFNTNTDKLLYPSTGGACFDVLVDILNRLYHQLCFVYKQCHNGPDSSGWSDCYYGRGIGGFELELQQ
ncbi:hypothetical protein, conserved [Babesia ovata]|uniref:Uncharacterized protein n=1 Tax=Babesia ovata TaxID=189622 RepID=A0A2H6KKJ3_9APIC|nr:uncharacterized protein BOVATA_050020 [Babesia ovata]GBE63509.1 hypothetical protein, conserved [Babesia ovata]